ncbi:MAG TPA: metallophosphoesterase [Thermoleophilaceae bacterium]|nr:metallophosphoesterase [Thermoleophilaceae bacterium]
MHTLVVSDLHLGAAFAIDVLRRPIPRERLAAEIRQADRLVLLGDLLELRELPLHQVLKTALPVLEEIGEGFAGEVIVVPGNHDHHLAAPLLEARRARSRPAPLGLEERVRAGRSGPLAQIARHLPRAEVSLAYPGVWLRDDVYATHGHYLDVHMTVPRAEVLGLAFIQRIVGGLPSGGRTPDDYELMLAPLYAFTYQLAQATAPGRAAFGTDFSARVWKQLNRRRPTFRARALGGVAIPLAVRALNRAGVGPFTTNLSPQSLRTAGLLALSEVIERLGIEAGWVIHGHTHRAGPLEADDPAAWRTPGGVRIVNSGNWIYEPSLVGRVPGRSPYSPGGCVVVTDEGPPEVRRLLRDASLDDVAGPVAEG